MKILISVDADLISEEDKKENEGKQTQHSLTRIKNGLKMVIDKMVAVGISRTLTQMPE
jgi:hypothetical protein